MIGPTPRPAWFPCQTAVELITSTRRRFSAGRYRLAAVTSPFTPKMQGMEGAGDVGVQHRDLVAAPAHLNGKQRGDQRLADASLAGRDGVPLTCSPCSSARQSFVCTRSTTPSSSSSRVCISVLCFRWFCLLYFLYRFIFWCLYLSFPAVAPAYFWLCVLCRPLLLYLNRVKYQGKLKNVRKILLYPHKLPALCLCPTLQTDGAAPDQCPSRRPAAGRRQA